MQKADVIQHFGGKQKNVVTALNCSKGTVSAWRSRIPEKVAGRLDKLTDGKLLYDPKDYE